MQLILTLFLNHVKLYIEWSNIFNDLLDIVRFDICCKFGFCFVLNFGINNGILKSYNACLQTPVKERPAPDTVPPPFSPAQGAIPVQTSIPTTISSLPLTPPTSPHTQQVPPKFSTPNSPPAVVSSSQQGQGHINLTGSQPPNMTGSHGPAENGPTLVLSETANINGPPTSSTVGQSGSPSDDSMHQMDKINKWEDFNSDEEKRGQFQFVTSNFKETDETNYWFAIYLPFCNDAK